MRLDGTAEDAREDAEDGRVPAKEGAAEVGVAVGEALVAPLKAALRGLLAEGLPAEEVEPTMATILHRLHAGLQKLRPNTQLAPWMHGVVVRVVEAQRPQVTGAPLIAAHLTAGDPTGQDRIAGALVPLLETLPPDQGEVLRLTDHGALTQMAAASRLGLSKVAFKSKVNSARRKLRVAVLAGLALTLESQPARIAPGADRHLDTRAPRRRVPASSLLSALTAGLEQLVRSWVPVEHASASAVAILAHLRSSKDHLPNNGRIPIWIYSVAREVLLAAPWASAPSTALAAPYPDRPSPEARATLAPAMRALLDGVLTDQARAVVLVDLDGHTQREAAKLEGILPETFKQRLWRARRHAWSTLHSALASSRKSEPSTPTIDMLIDSLQALVLHLAPTTAPAPVIRQVLRQLHQHARDQRSSASLVEHLYALTLAALQPCARSGLPVPPAEPGPAERAPLATALAPLLATLTPEQSEAVTLFDLDCLTLNAAAEHAGIDRPTFQGRLQRARLRLHALLHATLALPGPSSLDVS